MIEIYWIITGLFIGSTVTCAVAWWIESRANDADKIALKQAELAMDYAYKFNVSYIDALEVIRDHWKK